MRRSRVSKDTQHGITCSLALNCFCKRLSRWQLHTRHARSDVSSPGVARVRKCLEPCDPHSTPDRVPRALPSLHSYFVGSLGQCLRGRQAGQSTVRKEPPEHVTGHTTVCKEPSGHKGPCLANVDTLSYISTTSTAILARDERALRPYRLHCVLSEALLQHLLLFPRFRYRCACACVCACTGACCCCCCCCFGREAGGCSAWACAHASWYSCRAR